MEEKKTCNQDIVTHELRSGNEQFTQNSHAGTEIDDCSVIEKLRHPNNGGTNNHNK